MKFLKIFAILAVGIISMLAAAHFTESYVAQAAERERTLAEAVMKSQLEAELKRAEEQAKKELEEQGEALVTTVMETKPPVTETTIPETTASEPETTTTVPETETTSETAEQSDEIITEFTRGGLLPADRTGIPVKTLFGLTAEEQEQVTYFLIEHYFLDGYKYSEAEERPELKEKKRLAADMENSVVKTFNMILENVSTADISSILTADYAALKADAENIRNDFEEKYRNASDYGEEFGALYEDSLRYFDRLVAALEKMEVTSRKYNEASNPLLAIGLLTSSLDEVIIPEIMGVLEQSFDLVETSQEIFLEGTQGTRLLTRDEVKDIISNPALALYA
ncbi:MAG: hypothetical protein ACI4KG_07865 [Oscillospiraceae bacterium]